MDQEGKEKNMNYGSVFDEKRGWGKTEGKNMDQNFIKMWVKKKIWTMDQLSMKKVGEEDGRKKEKKEKRWKKKVWNSDSKWIAEAIHKKKKY